MSARKQTQQEVVARAARIQRRRRSTARFMALSAFLVVAAIVAMPSLLVSAVGLVPSLVAYVVDLTPGRYAFRCVFALNIAGLAPGIDRLWRGANDMSAALSIVSDVFAWLSFYGAASIGWMLFLGLPSLVAVVLTLDANRRVAGLRRREQELLWEWGSALGRGDESQDRPAEPGWAGASTIDPGREAA